MAPRFVAVEMHPAKLWWDLFCSPECCSQIHGDERPETFTVAEFAERTGCNVVTSRKCCFTCNSPLVPEETT